VNYDFPDTTAAFHEILPMPHRHVIPSFLQIRGQVKREHPLQADEFVDALANLAWCAHEDYAEGDYQNPLINNCSPTLLAWDYLTNKTEYTR
jgi:hypothetical protein